MYVTFGPKKIDWDAVYKTYRPQVNEQTTNDELYQVMTKMLDVLDDNHVYLKTYSNKQYILNYSLEELGKSLDPRQFYRINRQFIVSHKAVQKLHLHFNSKLKIDLRPTPDEEVMISREKAMAFRQWLVE